MKKRITRDPTDMRKYAGTCIEMAEPPVRHFVNTAIRTVVFGGEGDKIFAAFPYSFYFPSSNRFSQIYAFYGFFKPNKQQLCYDVRVTYINRPTLQRNPNE
jgi:hypothetical protein